VKKAARKSMWLAVGFVFLALAVVGSLLPFLQGWIFFLIALAIFARESETVRGWIRAARKRWPKLSAKVNKAAQHRYAPNFLKHVVHETDPHHRGR
jgi:uncharacterized membrane protein YbaN (DUF454 family)